PSSAPRLDPATPARHPPSPSAAPSSRPCPASFASGHSPALRLPRRPPPLTLPGTGPAPPSPATTSRHPRPSASHHRQPLSPLSPPPTSLLKPLSPTHHTCPFGREGGF